MKRTLILLFVSCLFALAPTSCVGQAKVFTSIAKLDGVTSVYIGKAALRLGAGAAMLQGEFAGSKAIRKLNSIEVVSVENSAVIPKAKTEAEKIIADKKMDVLVETKEDNESVVIYGGVPDSKNADIINDMLIYTCEPSELNLIYINGVINLAELLQEYDK